MKRIGIRARAGAFAENKDVARDLRLKEIVPALERKEDIILDFEGVEAATQSFVHALISDSLRKYGNGALDRMEFRSCNDTVKKIINIVVDYMQEGAD
ncbi:MAG: hypothetical protein A3J74_06150 [Elusimicrobia bacterium RIFCSPHIGHO2_02_FULL_57_9]|nr:MAG: hypothetical protein A3J74_06150 [Elusimicrobia bacterium RIFCSPHIGHO2_02_FULL_57_9]